MGGGFTPSGSLVKAVLLHSGKDLGGDYSYPGVEQGFGRVDLSSVLLVSGLTDGFDLFLDDYLLHSEESKSLFVNISSCQGTTFLKITISW